MNINKPLAFTVLCAAALLSGCGGGGDDNPAPPVTQQAPASVNMSVAAFVDYLKALIASSADLLEPVDVSGITPATDDTIEPTPLN
ncbi:MAG TPA: hypothetical protein VGM74_03140 [Burkholderiaceae bacterium]|jgi:hypothetical protein